MTHVEQTILAVVQALRKLRKEQSLPLHALVWGKWGAGKTVAARNISKQEADVFYIKIPDGDLSRTRLYRLIGFSLGCGARHSAESTIDLIRHHILYYGIQPILILDEAQRVIKKGQILDELKDLSEDQELSFCYIFLGDQTIPKIIAAHDHSLFRRFVIKRELQALSEDTITHLLKEYQIPADPAPIFHFARQRGWTTLDVSIVLNAIKTQKVEPTIETLDKIAKALGR